MDNLTPLTPTLNPYPLNPLNPYPLNPYPLDCYLPNPLGADPNIEDNIGTKAIDIMDNPGPISAADALKYLGII
jgi:hypothetical protein